MAFTNPTFNTDFYKNGALVGAAGTSAGAITDPDLTTLTNLGAIVDLSTYDPALAMETPPITMNADGDILPATLAPPLEVSVSTSASGGTLAANTYYYCVTAVNAAGESTPSNVISVTTTGSTSSNTITWTEPTTIAEGNVMVPESTLPTSYNVYRGTAANAMSAQYTNKTSPFTDTNAAANATKLPPTHNQADIAGDVVNY